MSTSFAPLDQTHEVLNQSTPLAGYNLFTTHRPLRDALAFHWPSHDDTHLRALGETVGTAEMQQHARLANVHAPQLHSHDRSGRRIDQVEFHPSYHALMGAAVRHGQLGSVHAGHSIIGHHEIEQFGGKHPERLCRALYCCYRITLTCQHGFARYKTVSIVIDQ